MSTFTGTSRSFDDDDSYLGYDPRLPSQRFNTFSNFDAESVRESVDDSSTVFGNQSYGISDELLSSRPVDETLSPSSLYSVGGGFSSFSPEKNGQSFDGGFGGSNGPILPPQAEMEADEGFALREWRRMNAIRLEEKERKEKETLQQIIQEAEEYKMDFYRRRNVTIESKRASNREKEKLFLSNREKFHAEAEKNYWKAVAELIPNEMPAMEKRGKKDKEKKPSIVVIQGPKPGKPTDLSRMRQMLLKLKHNTSVHMKPRPPPSSEPSDDSKMSSAAAAASSAGAGATTASQKIAAAAPA